MSGILDKEWKESELSILPISSFSKSFFILMQKFFVQISVLRKLLKLFLVFGLKLVLKTNPHLRGDARLNTGKLLIALDER